MKRPTIFVVDDEASICSLLTRVLEGEGYAVRAFADPEDALDALAHDPPELLISDLAMPNLSGFDLVGRARGLVSGLPAVVITGYASLDDVVEAVRRGVDDLVTKPFSVQEIRRVVARVLRRSARRRAPAATTPSNEIPSAPVRTPARRELPAEPARIAPDTSTDASAIDAAQSAFGERLRAASVIDHVHDVLGDELESWELVSRCGDALQSSLDASQAVLVGPGAAPGLWQVRSASLATDAARLGSDLELDALAPILSAGLPAPVSADAVAAVRSLLDRGPIAAAPTAPERHGESEQGVLLVSRARGREDFGANDLRVLAAAARAVGNVFRALHQNETTEGAYLDSLCAVVSTLESRSPGFERHSLRVRHVARTLGRTVGLSRAELDILDTSARLLDIGRLGIADSLLQKIEPPTNDEWRTLRDHTVTADQLIRPVGRLRHVKPVVRHHHENWDGSGYPDSLHGDEIPYLAAIVRIADAYVALTAPRSWRAALDHDAAIKQIVALAGEAFHPTLVEAFAESEVVVEGAADSRS